MIRLQDIADLAGVSRTTVSNVLYGKTSRVSPATVEKVSKLLKETGYVQNMGSLMLTKQQSNLIGLVIWADHNHGVNPLVDPFVMELLASFEAAAKQHGYYVMLIKTKSIDEITNIMNKFYIDGFLFFGYEGIYHDTLSQKLHKSIVLIDAYPKADTPYHFHNVGIDDFDGGHQVGSYLSSLGYNAALYLAEHTINADYQRWLGFKSAQQIPNSKADNHFLVLPPTAHERTIFYIEHLPQFLAAKALFFSCDYLAIEAINCFLDHGVAIPNDISIVGFDDSMYCGLSRPKLTTVKQDVHQKASLACEKLIKLIKKENVQALSIRNPVQLIVRDSVKIP